MKTIKHCSKSKFLPLPTVLHPYRCIECWPADVCVCAVQLPSFIDHHFCAVSLLPQKIKKKCFLLLELERFQVFNQPAQIFLCWCLMHALTIELADNSKKWFEWCKKCKEDVNEIRFGATFDFFAFYRLHFDRVGSIRMFYIHRILIWNSVDGAVLNISSASPSRKKGGHGCHKRSKNLRPAFPRFFNK